jgi:D-galactosamine 6-phosphate deaminase/isomerase
MTPSFERFLGPQAPGGLVEDWLATLKGRGAIGSLLDRDPTEQARLGYAHTLHEICQQPVTWIETAGRVSGEKAAIVAALGSVVANGGGSVVLTGSGSSLFVCDCLNLPLQESLRTPVLALPGGLLLTHPDGALPPSGPFLVVSFARSGDSPESRAVVDLLLDTRPLSRHLAVTCNRKGHLATAYSGSPRVGVVVLDEKTHDRSLVMTSSFTNMVLAGRFLGMANDAEAYRARAALAARAAADVLSLRADDLAEVAAKPFDSAVYLASGCRLGSARECALKMLEMNAGRVSAFAESYLGLRHGPMSAVHPETLVVAFLSTDRLARAYEVDLLRELDQKGIGERKVIVGAGVPAELARDGHVIVDCGASPPLADDFLTLVDAVVGQLLACFRCLKAGLRPDSPSDEGIINRVVQNFVIQKRS